VKDNRQLNIRGSRPGLKKIIRSRLGIAAEHTAFYNSKAFEMANVNRRIRPIRPAGLMTATRMAILNGRVTDLAMDPINRTGQGDRHFPRHRRLQRGSVDGFAHISKQFARLTGVTSVHHSGRRSRGHAAGALRTESYGTA